jgi:hypothetical protein
MTVGTDHAPHETDAERKLRNLVGRQRELLGVMHDALTWCAGTYEDAVAKQALAKVEEMRR